MDQIEIASIQRSTSRIGLGCGRLVGGVSARSSRAIIEAALEAGITELSLNAITRFEDAVIARMRLRCVAVKMASGKLTVLNGASPSGPFCAKDTGWSDNGIQ